MTEEKQRKNLIAHVQEPWSVVVISTIFGFIIIVFVYFFGLKKINRIKVSWRNDA